MPTLELTSTEAGMLRSILEGYLGDLRMEVAHTDSMDYREKLKVKEALVKKVLTLL